MKAAIETDSIQPVRVAICGTFQRGKSLLVNCLLGRRVAMVGRGKRTTPIETHYCWGADERVEVFNHEGRQVPSDMDRHAALPLAELLAHYTNLSEQADGDPADRPAKLRVLLREDNLRRVVLVDTPGLDCDAADSKRAEDAAKGVDFILFLAANRELSSVERKFLNQCDRLQKACVMLLNCFPTGDRWDPNAALNRDEANNWIAGGQDFGFRIRPEPLLVNVQWWAMARGVIDDSEQERRKAWKLAEAFLGTSLKDDHDLLIRSRGHEVECLFRVPPERIVGVNAYCLGRLHRAATEWTTKVQTQIEATKAALNKK